MKPQKHLLKKNRDFDFEIRKKTTYNTFINLIIL